jgi:hypothetical protein
MVESQASASNTIRSVPSAFGVNVGYHFNPRVRR